MPPRTPVTLPSTNHAGGALWASNSLIRWGVALVLVLVTYNPTSLNYVRWAMNNSDTQLPLVILFGLVLAIGYIIFFRATFRSIGVVGIAIVAALVGAILGSCGVGAGSAWTIPAR